MSMKERIAMFSAGKGAESTPEKTGSDSTTPVKSNETPARRSSIADKIAALKAGSAEKPVTPGPVVTPGKLNPPNSVTTPTPAAPSATASSSTGTPEVEDSGKKKTSIADRIAAMKASGADKSTEPKTVVTPVKVSAAPVPLPATKAPEPQPVIADKPVDPPVDSSPAVRRKSIGDRIASLKAAHTATIESQPTSTSEDIKHIETAHEANTTAIGTSTTTDSTTPSVPAQDTVVPVVAEKAVDVATPIKEEQPKPQVVSTSTASAATQSTVSTADTTPQRRSSIADRIAALKAGGGSDSEPKPTAPVTETGAKPAPSKLVSPFGSKGPPVPGAVPEGAAASGTAAAPAEKRVNKFGELTSALLLLCHALYHVG